MKTIPLPGYIQRLPKHIKLLLSGFAVGVLGVSIFYIATLLPMFGQASTATVTTSSADNITRNSTTLTGSINNTGGKNVTERGIKYGTTASYGSTVSNTLTEPYIFSTKFGSSGSANGQFSSTLSGLATDSSGNVYVVDSNNSRVQKFNNSGVFSLKFGSSGSTDGKFNFPNRVAVDSSGNIYVTDYNNSRVQKFDSSGNFLLKFGTAGNGSSQLQFNKPSGIAVDSSGNIYVTDTTNNRVVKVNAAGTTQLATWGSFGTSAGQFNQPVAIKISPDGFVYVAEFNGNRIQKFNTSGVYQGVTIGSTGTSPGQFSSLEDFAFDSSGNIYTVQAGYPYGIQKFNSSGTYVSRYNSVFGNDGDDGQFYMSFGIAIDSSDNIFISDRSNFRIQKFIPNTPYPTGDFSLEVTGLTCGTLYHYQAYAVNDDGTGTGSDQTFTTSTCAAAPTTSTQAASSISRYAATLNGSVDSFSGSDVSERGFEYGLTASYGTTTAISTSVTTDAYTLDISALTCGTTYHFRAYAINITGTGNGTDQTFTSSACPAAPTVTVQAASGITRTVATLNGSVDSFSSSDVSERGFEYGLTTSYGTTTPVSTSITSDDYSLDIALLTCGTTYHYRGFATNISGTGHSNDQTFTTSDCPAAPVVSTQTAGATNTNAFNSTQLNGTVTDFANSNITERGFQVGTSISYGTTLLAESSSIDAYSAHYGGLSVYCDTTYHYRAYATNANGTSYGSDVTFYTGTCPAQTDFKLSTSITSAQPITSGQAVTYHYKVTNEGPNSTTLGFGGSLYIVLPSEFTLPSDFNSHTNVTAGSNISCVDYGLTQDTVLGNQMFGNYPNQRLVICTGANNSSGFSPGQSYELDITGTANSNFSTGNTLSRGLYVNVTNAEIGFRTALVNAISTNSDLFSLPYNNVNVFAYGSEQNQLPTVSVTQPTQGQLFDFGDSVQFNTSTSDVDGTIDSVEFMLDGESIGSDSNSPYTITASGLPTGNHTIIARAKDNLNGISSSSPITFSVGDAVPIVTTSAVSNRSKTTSTLIGDVSSIGSSSLTARGFQYGLSESYGSTLSVNVNATGEYSLAASGLTCGETYHYRAIATNSVGTSYGQDRIFTTLDCGDLPAVSTNSTSVLTATSRSLSGEILSVGGSSVTNRGFNYGLTTAYGSKVSDTPSSQIAYKGQWSTEINLDKAFALPSQNIVTDSANNIYIAPRDGSKVVKKYDRNGNLKTEWGSESGPGQLLGPWSIAVDSHDNVYIADIIGSSTSVVKKYSSSGEYIKTISTFSTLGLHISRDDKIFTYLPYNNEQNGDINSYTIAIYSLDGDLLNIIVPPNDKLGIVWSLTTDSAGNVYTGLLPAGSNDETCLTEGNCEDTEILKFDSYGNYLSSFGTFGTGNNQFKIPHSMATDSSNNLYVADALNNRIQILHNNSNGELEYSGQLGTTGNDADLFDIPFGIATNNLGDVFVRDYGSNSIDVYSLFQEPGTFNLSVNGLSCGKTYHYQAYAINGSGTTYGQDKTFSTALCPAPPIIVITAPTNKQVFGVKTTAVDLASEASSPTSVIDRVEFIVDGVYVGSVNNQPYSLTATGLSVGAHTLVARAYDVLGVWTDAEPVTFYVSPPVGPYTPSNPNTPVGTTIPTKDIPGLSPGDQLIYKTSPQSDSNESTPKIINAKNGWLYIIFGHKIFKAVPFSLILLLLLMALMYARLALKEYLIRVKIINTMKRYDATLQATNDYLAISAHYLNTPVAIMNGAVELIASLKVVSEDTIKHLHTKLQSFSKAVEQILVSNQTSAAKTQFNPPKLNPKVQNPILDPAVWVPSSVVLVCLVVANLLFIKVGVLTTSFARIAIEIGLFLLAFLLLALSKRYIEVSKSTRELSKQQLSAQAALFNERRDFIDSTRIVLDNHYDELKLAGNRIKTVPQSKLYFNGLGMVASLAHGLGTVHDATNMTSEAPLFSITAFVKKISKDFQQYAMEKDIALNVKTADGITAKIQPEEIRQVLSSLVDNAIKFNKPGGSVEISAKKHFTKVVLTVSDTGVGISPDKLEKLFQPFSRATESMQYDYEGIGLSLYANKVILARLGGDISLTSQPNKGTTVTVTLPSASKQGSLVVPEMITPTVIPQVNAA